MTKNQTKTAQQLADEMTEKRKAKFIFHVYEASIGFDEWFKQSLLKMAKATVEAGRVGRMSSQHSQAWRYKRDFLGKFDNGYNHAVDEQSQLFKEWLGEEVENE